MRNCKWREWRLLRWARLPQASIFTSLQIFHPLLSIVHMHFQEQNEYLAKKYDKSNDFGLPTGSCTLYIHCTSNGHDLDCNQLSTKTKNCRTRLFFFLQEVTPSLKKTIHLQTIKLSHKAFIFWISPLWECGCFFLVCHCTRQELSHDYAAFCIGPDRHSALFAAAMHYMDYMHFMHCMHCMQRRLN